MIHAVDRLPLSLISALEQRGLTYRMEAEGAFATQLVRDFPAKALARLRARFGASCNPVLDRIEVRDDGVTDGEQWVSIEQNGVAVIVPQDWIPAVAEAIAAGTLATLAKLLDEQ